MGCPSSGSLCQGTIGGGTRRICPGSSPGGQLEKGRSMALQVSSLGLRMEDNDFHVAAGLRLGVPLYQPHKCQQCRTPVDGRGTHGLHCRKSVGRHLRHSAINDVIKRSLGAAKISAHLEPVGICRSRSDRKRPDGTTVLPWRSGRILIWNATCPNTFAPSHIDLVARGPGAVADQAEERKKAMYTELATTHLFIPLAVETTGVLDQRLGHFSESSAAESSMRQASPWPTNIFCSELQWPCTGGERSCSAGHILPNRF